MLERQLPPEMDFDFVPTSYDPMKNFQMHRRTTFSVEQAVL